MAIEAQNGDYNLYASAATVYNKTAAADGEFQFEIAAGDGTKNLNTAAGTLTYVVTAGGATLDGGSLVQTKAAGVVRNKSRTRSVFVANGEAVTITLASSNSSDTDVDVTVTPRVLRTNTVQIGGTAQTARDIGASVLLSSGTGTGQVSLSSGVVAANVTQANGLDYNTSGGMRNIALQSALLYGAPAGVLASPDGAAAFELMPFQYNAFSGVTFAGIDSNGNNATLTATNDSPWTWELAYSDNTYTKTGSSSPVGDYVLGETTIPVTAISRDMRVSDYTAPPAAATVAAAVAAQATGSAAGSIGKAAADAATSSASILAKLLGITVLANWLRAMFRKDTPDETALSEINLGGGTYATATDSLEAQGEKTVLITIGGVSIEVPLDPETSLLKLVAGYDYLDANGRAISFARGSAVWGDVTEATATLTIKNRQSKNVEASIDGSVTTDSVVFELDNADTGVLTVGKEVSSWEAAITLHDGTILPLGKGRLTVEARQG